ncbi:cell wall elongation regulator TseB-like domain-containing protein [Tenuibacillus multivorans]|uniref:Uncharacterized protein YpmB n=1 Tax=Tenuibacillus multivorans TaxID=237069 RepID=A0A1H0CSB6_9BACI|nr:DUF5590 domain-containing protein [Tenuibacillus multivorans]GEL76181.1 hypothetical protein TMU01_04160 [Tenuibacillus multivorans]SDN60799.1 Uncharacterized protein YpmB [Tenuibacillus multivorans]
MQFLQISGRKLLLSSLTILTIVILCLLILLIFIYTGIRQDQNDAKSYAVELAINESPLTQEESVGEFTGEQAYMVVTGKNEDDERIHVFVPENAEESPQWVSSSEGISKEEMRQKWSQDCGNCHLNSMNLGILNNRYVWEIIYEKNNRLYFQTFRFSNGELYDSISFSQS